MDGGLAYNSNRTPALNPTGSATSLYMKQFWGHDENLMYFRNHEYPLMGKGWGSTCDYILLSDGDRLDVAMFTNWDFYKDGGFNQFSQDVYSIAQGDTVTTSTFKAGTSAAEDGESPELEAISGLNVAVYDKDWNKVADITGDGTYSYTFDKAGTYYLMATDTGAKTTAAHYAPATAKVTVTPRDDSGAITLKTAADMLWFQNYVNEQIAKIDCDGFAIGGLAVGEPTEVMYEIIDAVEPYMPADKPRYLMGVGTPSNIIEGVTRGVDFFDCVMPARNARHGKLFTWQGTMNIKNAQYKLDDGSIDPQCDCPVCRKFSRAYLRHLFTAQEMLGMRLAVMHNLYFYNKLTERIRQALDADEFDAFRAEYSRKLAEKV